MLTIAKVESDRARYYLSTTAIGADHAGGLVEPDGVWMGRQATALGLEGVAEPAGVRALLAGRSPVDGERLLPLPDRRRLSAYDLAFSTPKSVSVLFALARPDVTEQIRLAHEGAVQATLRYLERHAVLVREGQVDGRRWLTRVDGGVTAVAWLHRSSRAPDPHLHTHVLVANLARHHSGEWRPLDARDIYAELRTAGALFETHLRLDLTTRLGLRWRELNGAWADVEGSDQRVLRAFSQRSARIAEELAASGLQGRAAAHLIGELTRPPKDVTVPYPQLVEGWRRRAHEEGLSAAHLAGMLGRPSHQHAEAPAWEELTLAGAASRSLDGSFTRRELIQARCAAAPAGRAVEEVERDVDQLLASPRLLALGQVGGGRRVRLKTGQPLPSRAEDRYTTAALTAMEERVVDVVARQPSRLTVIAYRPGERATALDRISTAAAVWSRQRREVAAVAPGWRAAASFEAATGIESVSTRVLLPPGSSGSTGFEASTSTGRARDGGSSIWDSSGWSSPAPSSGGIISPWGHGRGAVPMPDISPGGVLVIADAQCFSAGVLELALTFSRARGAELVIVGPGRDFSERSILAGAAQVAAGSLPSAGDVRDGVRLEPGVVLRRDFGGVGAVVTTSLGAAISEAVRELQQGPPASVLVVAADHSIVNRLREEVADSTRSRFVLHANDLDAALSPGTNATGGCGAAKGRLVVIGGAATLRAGADRSGFAERRHVLVLPPASGLALDHQSVALDVVAGRSVGGRTSERAVDLDAVVGRAAEACCPRYLSAELGAPRRDQSERAAWRSAAVTIEAFRERWGVTDGRSTFGMAREVGPDRQDWDRERRRVRDIVRERDVGRELGSSRARGLGLDR